MVHNINILNGNGGMILNFFNGNLIFCSDSMFETSVAKSGFVPPVKLVPQGHKKRWTRIYYTV